MRIAVRCRSYSPLPRYRTHRIVFLQTLQHSEKPSCPVEPGIDVPFLKLLPQGSKIISSIWTHKIENAIIEITSRPFQRSSRRPNFAIAHTGKIHHLSLKEKSQDRNLSGPNIVDVIGCDIGPKHSLTEMSHILCRILPDAFMHMVIQNLHVPSGHGIPKLGISSRFVAPAFKHMVPHHACQPLVIPTEDATRISVDKREKQPICPVVINGTTDSAPIGVSEIDYLIDIDIVFDEVGIVEIFERRLQLLPLLQTRQSAAKPPNGLYRTLFASIGSSSDQSPSSFTFLRARRSVNKIRAVFSPRLRTLQTRANRLFVVRLRSCGILTDSVTRLVKQSDVVLRVSGSFIVFIERDNRLEDLLGFRSIPRNAIAIHIALSKPFTGN